MTTTLLPRLLAPYVAVLVFWCWLQNAWLAILAYHAQVVIWLAIRQEQPHIALPSRRRQFLLALPTVIPGPLLYVLLPHVSRMPLGDWLTEYRCTGLALILMIPYVGVLHPALEQAHWSPLRRATPVAHVLFAGYHVLVLYRFLTVPWLALCFVVLLTASAAWEALTRRTGSLAVPTLSHILADLGVILAAHIAAV